MAMIQVVSFEEHSRVYKEGDLKGQYDGIPCFRIIITFVINQLVCVMVKVIYVKTRAPFMLVEEPRTVVFDRLYIGRIDM